MGSNSSSPEGRAREKIDEQLSKSGWSKLGEYIDWTDLDQIDGTGYIAELGTDTGPADYGFLIDGELAAILEAKPMDKSAEGHFSQAERYSKSVDSPFRLNETHRLPIIYVANGIDMHLYDLREEAPTSRPISAMHTPDGLMRLITRDYKSAFQWNEDNPPKAFDPDLWSHQKECVEAVEESLRLGRRRMLIKMATGSGKTRVAKALSYRLLKSGLADNILFIPDTRKLADDAYISFSGYHPTGVQSSFSDKYRIVNLQEDESDTLDRGDVVITTLQKMYHLLGNDEIDFNLGDFDCIITDECHRSVYENEGYGAVFEQFDAIEIGLTATPTQRTLARFDNNLVYDYGYEKAVKDGNVVPFQMYALETEITMGGVLDQETGEYYSPDDLGSKVLVPDTHRKVGQEIRDRMEDENELTLIFARNDNHATQIVSDLRETVFSDKPDAYIKKITYKVDRPNDILTRFSDPYDPSPAIAVTVQMVSTGVDIRPLKNVVLLNPVKSPVLFNQMLGRGTRVYDDKKHFNIYDCVGALEYFDGVPPFGTIDYENENGGGSSDQTDDSDDDDGPAIVDVPDEILRSEPVFPTETGERLTADGFINAFHQDVMKREKDIRQIFNESEDVESATEDLRPILEEISQYYIPIFLSKAYQSITREEHLLIDYVNDALTGSLPTFDDRIAYASSSLRQDYDLSDVEKQYLELISITAEPPNGISKSDFFDPPLSEIGGWKRANRDFNNIQPLTLVSEFRHCMCDLIGEYEETGTSSATNSTSDQNEEQC